MFRIQVKRDNINIDVRRKFKDDKAKDRALQGKLIKHHK